MEQETAGADAEKKDKIFVAVLHTEGQRKRAEAHEDRLKKEGQNATLVLCSDISSIESLNIDDVDSLHLIVDTYMYGILMDIDRLCDAAYKKFKELDRARRTVYVLNHFQNEFDKLYHLIPENVREKWDKNEQERLHKGDGISHRQRKDHLTTFEECEFDVKGVSGGSMKTSNTCGNVGGGMGNTNSGDVANNPGMTGMSKDCTIENQTNFYFETKGEYKISCIRIGEQNSSTARVEQGLQPSPESHLLVTIKSEGNDQAISDTVEKNQDKLKSKEVRDVQIMNGSVIIKLIVEKNYIMTDAWVQSILMMLFYDILGDFFTEETTFEVSVERKVCLGEEELIKLYTSQENHSNCVSKVEFEAMKSKLKEMALQGQDCSSLNGSPKIKTETHDENKFDQEPVGENRIDNESFRENPLLAEKLLETRQGSSQQRHSDDEHNAEFHAKKLKPEATDSEWSLIRSLNIKAGTLDEGTLEENEIEDKSCVKKEKLLAEQQIETCQASDDGNRRKEEEEELDVLTEAPVVAVRKETRQLHREL